MHSKYFKYVSILAFAALAALSGVGCTERSTSADKFIIGDKVTESSAAIRRDGEQASRIAVFDRNVGRIHLFATTDLAFLKSFTVDRPESAHYVLYSEAGGYIVDLSEKHLTIIKGSGETVRDPVRFSGNPLSTIFRPDQGLLAIYDDRNSLVLMKLSADGQVTDFWEAGVLIDEEKTILSGDMTDDGRLVFALAGETLAVIDMQNAITQKKWGGSNLTTFTHTIDRVAWVGIPRGQSNLVMVAGSSHVALIDLTLKAVSGTPLDLEHRRVLHYSKSVDPHLILDGSPGTMIFTRSGALSTRDIPARTLGHVWASSLDLGKQVWQIIDFSNWKGLSEEDREPTGRAHSRYDFGTMRGTDSRELPDGPRVELMQSTSFGYFATSKFGHAASFSPADPTRDQHVKGFNVPYLRK